MALGAISKADNIEFNKVPPRAFPYLSYVIDLLFILFLAAIFPTNFANPPLKIFSVLFKLFPNLEFCNLSVIAIDAINAIGELNPPDSDIIASISGDNKSVINPKELEFIKLVFAYCPHFLRFGKPPEKISSHAVAL